MAEYIFKVTQEATTYFRGNLNIQAKNEKKAKEKIADLSQEEINNLITDWELCEEGADATGFIEVFDDEGKLINEL